MGVFDACRQGWSVYRRAHRTSAALQQPWPVQRPPNIHRWHLPIICSWIEQVICLCLLQPKRAMCAAWSTWQLSSIPLLSWFPRQCLHNGSEVTKSQLLWNRRDCTSAKTGYRLSRFGCLSLVFTSPHLYSWKLEINFNLMCDVVLLCAEEGKHLEDCLRLYDETLKIINA